jgi:hypothetical protein
MTLYQYGIAVGWNNTPTNVESIVPTSDRKFFPPTAFSSFSPGTIRVRADGQLYETGFESVTWRFSVLTRKQYQYLMTTYSTGGNSYSGPVSIETIGPAGTYITRNAIMILPTLPELTRQFIAYRDVDVRFIRLTAQA